MSGNLTNLGYSAQTNTLFASNIINHNGTVTIQLPTIFQIGGIQKIVFESNGNIDTLGKFKLYSGTDLATPFTSTNRYTIQLNSGNDFEIFDNVANASVFKIDSSTKIGTILGLTIPDVNGNPLPWDITNTNGVLDFNQTGDSGQISFGTDGQVYLVGTSNGIYLYDRTAGNILSQIYQDAGGRIMISGVGAGFTGVTVSGDVTATTFIGNLTGSATLMDNTLQTTGTQFLTMMPLSATTPAGQVVGTHGTLTYNVATGTVTATTFSGSLTGSATLMDNTLQTTGTQFLTMMPLSATTPAGQVVGTHGSLTYNVATGTVTATTFNGDLTGLAYNSNAINTVAVGSNTNFSIPFVLQSATTPGQQLYTDLGSILKYNPSTGTLTATTFSGSLTGSATLMDNTLQTTGTQFLTMMPLSATTPAGQVVGTHAPLSYNVATATLNSFALTTTGTNNFDGGEINIKDKTIANTFTNFITTAGILGVTRYVGSTPYNLFNATPTTFLVPGDVSAPYVTITAKADSRLYIAPRLSGALGFSIFNDPATTGFGYLKFQASNGNVAAALYSDGNFTINGGGNFLGWYDRTSGIQWGWYSDANQANLFYVGVGTRMSVTTGGVVTATAFVPPSDIRLKENIQDLSLDYSLEILSKLRPKTYNMKCKKVTDTKGNPVECEECCIEKKERSKTKFGFIAQDIETDFDVANKPIGLHHIGQGEEKFQGLDYIQLISPMVKVIQDLLLQQQSLLKRVLDLEQKLNVPV